MIQPQISDILGYAGTACLALRFIPIVKDYYCNNFLEYSNSLIILEICSDILLGASGYLIGSKPMVIANGICLTASLSIIIHHKCKCICNKRNSHRVRWAPYGSLSEGYTDNYTDNYTDT